MPVCDACHRDLGDVFVVDDGSKLCARCLEMGVHDRRPPEERSRMMLVLDGDDELAS
ncbi:MAG TPA: hypothetical protein VFF60_01385 [Candidatus Binatus sp.]|jgi:hypothetical protein|nr:hypothetical protein [Candidatus Binatus sp.]